MKELYEKWLKCKQRENEWKNKRLSIEKKLQEHYDSIVENQSKTFKDAGFVINYKKNFVFILDETAYNAIRSSIPENLRPEKIKISLDMAKYNKLEEKNEKIYKQISDCVTMKVNKPTIKITKEEKNGIHGK